MKNFEGVRPLIEDRRAGAELLTLYAEAQRQLRLMALLNEASKVINASLDINEIMQSLLAQMNEWLRAEAISIALVDRQTNELVYEVAEGIGSDKIVGLRLPRNQGISGWVMDRGEPALVADTSRDLRFFRQGDTRTGYQTRAMICAPLTAKGRVLGTIQAINPIEGNFTQQDLQLLVNLANLASSAINNAQQHRQTQQVEARYLGLFEDSIDPIILTDAAGRIIDANRPASNFLGYAREELLQLSIVALHPVETGIVECHLPKIMQGVNGNAFTSRAITKDRRFIPVEVHGKRITTAEQEMIQWIHHDISKQVELEALRKDLLAMLFHDLQNPLGNIMASLELMSYEVSPSEQPQLASMLDVATRSSERLRTLIRSLLDISRLEAGDSVTDRRPVAMSEIIAEVHGIVEPSLLRRNIGLKINLEPRLPKVFVDEDMIRRVFINLLDNALKFSQEQQSVHVNIHKVPNKKVVQVSVSDGGPGILEQYRQLVFDKFQRLPGKDSRKGMGLGLAFCRLAVEAHGGEIWITDAPDGGAQFNLTLPTSA